MAVVTQKDIVKIINSSIDNIEVIINSLAKNIDKIISNADADKLKDNIEDIKSVSNVVGNYIKIITDLISKIPDIKSSNSAKIGTSAVALNNATQLVVAFVETINNDKLKEIDKSSFKRVDDVTMILNNLSKMFNAMNNMCQPGIHLIGLGKQGEFAIKSIIRILEATEDFKKIDTEAAANNIEHVNKVIDSLHSIFLNVSKMITLSLVVALAGWIIIGAVLMIVFLAKIIVKLVAIIGVSNDASKKIKNLEIVFISLYSIMKTLIKMIPAAILSLVGMVMAIVFVSLLIVVVLIINTLLKITSKIDDNTVKQIIGLGRVFKAMLSMCGAIIFLALVVPIAAFALVMIIIPFLIVALLVYAIIAVSSWLLHKLSDFSRKQFLLLAWNTLIIVGIFIIMCIGIVLAATAGEELQKNGSWKKIGWGLLGILGMLALCVAIGYVLNLKKVKVSLLAFRKTFPILLQIIAIIGLLMIAIAAVGYAGEYVSKNWDSILWGLGAISVIVVIVGGISFLLKKWETHFLTTNTSVIALMYILALLVMAGLSLIVFGYIGEYVSKNWDSILWGLGAISVIVGIVGVISFLLKKWEDKFLSATTSIIPLLMILGLLVAAALTIMVFGYAGKYLTENLESVLAGFAGVIVIVGIVGVISFLLKKWEDKFLSATKVMIPLLIILGLMVVAALAIVLFGKVGEYIHKNIISILEGLAGIVVVVGIIIALAALLGWASPVISGAAVTFIPLLIVLGLMVVAAIAILEFADIGKELEANYDAISNGVWAIWDIIWCLVGFGLSLTLALIPMTLAAAISTPVLLAVNIMLALLFGIADGVNKLVEIKIESNKINEALESIKAVLTTLATSIKDLLNGEETGDSPIFELPEPEIFSLIPFRKRKVTAIDKLDNVTKIITTLKNIVDALIQIEKFKFTKTREGELINAIESIFEVIKTIAEKLNTMLSDPNAIHFNDKFVDESTWWGGTKKVETENESISKLDNVSKITSTLSSITEALNNIQKLNINETAITKKIDSIFAYMGTISTQIETNIKNKGLLTLLEDKTEDKTTTNWLGETTTEKVTVENQIAKNMSRVGEIFGSLGNVLETLQALSEFKLSEEMKTQINNNLNALFEYINQISLKINNLLNPDASQVPLVYTPEFRDKIVKDKETVTDIIKNKSEDYANNLDNVSKIFVSVANILENLNKIKDLKFTDTIKTDVNNKINLIFTSIEEIINTVNSGIKKLPGEGLDTTGLDNIANGLTNLCDVMNKLCEIKINNFSKTKTVLISFLKEMTLINYDKFKNSDKICTVINSMSTLLTSGPTSFKLMEQRLGHLERLSKVIIALGEVTPAGVKRSKELLNDQIKYLNKVNSVDINKLKITANMLSSMADLSRSINGNFQGLAKTLNEEIAPLLEKLKELMESMNNNVTTYVGGSGGSGGGSYYINRPNSGLTASGSNGAGDMLDIDDWETVSKNKNNGAFNTNVDNEDDKKKAWTNNRQNHEQYLNNANWSVSTILNEIYQLMLGYDHNGYGGLGVVVDKNSRG